MKMDLTNMISNGTEETQVPEQKLTKEEYAAKKQQEREEVWAEVDAQAQDVFQKGEKLKGFLDFMAEQYPAYSESTFDLRTEAGFQSGKVL